MEIDANIAVPFQDALRSSGMGHHWPLNSIADCSVLTSIPTSNLSSATCEKRFTLEFSQKSGHHGHECQDLCSQMSGYRHSLEMGEHKLQVCENKSESV
jgi:hypothetical protein